MRENRTKRLLREGKTVVGGWIATHDPYTVEVMADVGFDFLVVDTEHEPQTAHTLQSNLMAMKDTPVTPITRVLWNDFVRVKQALDLGSQGIVFPFVNTPEEARQAVASVRYPPRGIRGWGPRRAVRLADDPLDYFHHADENILVLCQVETRQALENAEANARVEGVDALLIGPTDLSIGLGVPLDLDSPVFGDAVRRVHQATEAAGKAFGVITSGAEPARRWMQMGARMVVAGNDSALLRMIAASTLKELREAVKTRDAGQVSEPLRHLSVSEVTKCQSLSDTREDD
jgi:4-hydroxy-2-oxoheptanedioate aldolase